MRARYSRLAFVLARVCGTIKTITTGRHTTLSMGAPNNRRNMHKYVIAEWLFWRSRDVHAPCARAFNNNNSNFFYVGNRRAELNVICVQPGAFPSLFRCHAHENRSHTHTTEAKYLFHPGALRYFLFEPPPRAYYSNECASNCVVYFVFNV
jgi:hypothetical protein